MIRLWYYDAGISAQVTIYLLLTILAFSCIGLNLITCARLLGELPALNEPSQAKDRIDGWRKNSRNWNTRKSRSHGRYHRDRSVAHRHDRRPPAGDHL